MRGGQVTFEMTSIINPMVFAPSIPPRVIDNTFVTVPVIRATDKSFKVELPIEIAAATNCTVYYTLDGTTPDSTSKKYETPFVVKETTTVKENAIDNENHASNVVVAKFY